MKAPAKINLYLNITGKRDDGYHLLDTLIVFTDIYDEIEITPANRFSLEIAGSFAHLVENDEKNIVVRALNLMAQACGKEPNVYIKLIKNIPVGAGLGGGSSDAAITLILLNDLWNAGFSKEKLASIGIKLGADVPIFINRHAAFVSGIGEKISNVKDMPELYAILVYPNKLLSTKDVFGKFAQNNSIQNQAPHNEEFLEMPENWLSFLKNKNNDLENAAIELLPEIKGLIKHLSGLEACQFARMSGSGSTCFAIFTDKQKAEIAISSLQYKYPDFWIKLANIVQTF